MNQRPNQKSLSEPYLQQTVGCINDRVALDCMKLGHFQTQKMDQNLKITQYSNTSYY